MVWHFAGAPKEFQELSTNGGDEDWVAVLPKDFGWAPMWLEEGGSFGCCSVDEHELPDGRRVFIGSHA
jgi:hypothetical protein